MNKPLISIIVPCYNTGEFVNKCIESILNQSYKNIEVIAVEHDSEDNTLQSLLKIAKKDKRLKVIKSYATTTTGTTRNLGIMASKGEYLCFCDSDDSMEEDMIELLYNRLMESDADVAYCDTNIIDYEKPNVSVPRKIHNNYELITNEEIMYELMHSTEVMNKMIKRELIFEEGILFNDVTNGEDLYFSQLLYAKAKRITYLQKPLYNYLVNRPKSTVTTPRSNFDKQVLLTLIKVMEFHRKNNSSNKEIIEAALYNYALEHYIRFYHLKKTGEGNPKDYMEFVHENFPRIENNRFYKSDIKPLFYKNKASMYDKMAEGKSVFIKNPIIIFSASKGGRDMLNHMKELSIIPQYFCDNDLNKHGTIIDGVEVVAPSKIIDVEGAVVVIASDIKYYNDIKNQLKGYGIPDTKIYP